ncbi:nitrate reductase [Jannaschia pohangensis]|uniref:Assimilatory nitrate reductase (NADH) alpha subunit apoprotein n=1 Tax=Jannaschia pohangensis TaxID=390807 RepID=A0A1I3HEE9_9RHOB|nr:nitrate reductase [Jannaschia pohangensis]SFI34106.1 assimilatory nitrate reductase (NADH) alpha subunit apoprotein [Jannaschia pohangensis]
MNETRTTCPYCGVGCGVLLRQGPEGVSVRGDPDHPANFGRLCSKGSALAETLTSEGRLLQPRVDGADVSWDVALSRVADGFRTTLERHGPGSVAFYLSGQLLTEDYYVANKLMKGFMGSANIDTNSRLCMASTVAGHRRAFGSDTVPGTYEDLDEADLVVLVGSNLAWCHPVLFQRLVAAKAARGTKVVVVDPRRTATCDAADLHLALRGGSDTSLFNGLLAYLHANGHVDHTYVGAHVSGLDAAVAMAQRDLSTTGLSAEDLAGFHALWARSERVVTVFSQGVNQSTGGTDKVNAILNCHLATGRIGRPGCGPLSVTGQPNAMGGREVGGLANMLAAHLDLEDPVHRSAVGRFWDAPAVADRPGLKAIDMFRAVRSGQIKALWIACTNPVASMPEADLVAEAIRTCDLSVVSDMYATTDTARCAQIVLPALGWAEKDGTVTNSDRTISRQRGVVAAPGSARADWDIFAEVGRRMGWREAFSYASPAEVFREHAALSGIAGRLGRDFDISDLSGLDDRGYAALAPTRWPVSGARQGGRFFGAGGFFTPDGRGRMIPVATPEETASQPRYPFRLNTGRIRDQWHTMTRSALTPRLSRHLAEPFLELHPADAVTLGLRAADIAQVQSPLGRALLRVLVTDRVAPGAPFAPMHWTAEFASAGRVDALIPGAVDPVSGQPDLKAARVAISPFPAVWYGFAVSRSKPAPDAAYWARSRIAGGWAVEMAGDVALVDWAGRAAAMFGLTTSPQTVTDRVSGQVRLAFFEDGLLHAALFVSPGPVAVERAHVAGLLGQIAPDVLSGRSGAGRLDPGPVVCSCLGVGRNTIVAAAEAGMDVEACTGAGSNCGSCKPEIAALIAGLAVRAAAE